MLQHMLTAEGPCLISGLGFVFFPATAPQNVCARQGWEHTCCQCSLSYPHSGSMSWLNCQENLSGKAPCTHIPLIKQFLWFRELLGADLLSDADNPHSPPPPANIDYIVSRGCNIYVSVQFHWLLFFENIHFFPPFLSRQSWVNTSTVWCFQSRLCSILVNKSPDAVLVPCLLLWHTKWNRTLLNCTISVIYAMY